MKIVDEKGKLFGKINIIDFVIVLLCVAVVAGIGYKLFFKGDNSIEHVKVTQEAEVTFRIKTIIAGAEEALQKGDRLIIEDNITDAEIIDIQIRESQSANADADGKIVISDNPLYKEASIVVKMNVDVTEESISFEGEHLKANDTFQFETAKFKGNAEIIEISYEE